MDWHSKTDVTFIVACVATIFTMFLLGLIKVMFRLKTFMFILKMNKFILKTFIFILNTIVFILKH